MNKDVNAFQYIDDDSEAGLLAFGIEDLSEMTDGQASDYLVGLGWFDYDD